MRKLWVLALLPGCLVGREPGKGDEHGEDDPVPVSGTITADTTWMGTMSFTGTTVIAPGVTVNVAAGTTLVFAQSAGIDVQGALFIHGTAAGKVIAKPAEGATKWGPIQMTGGVRMTYGDFTGGSFVLNGINANLFVEDSKMYRTDHDYLIINGGRVDMKYSQIGAADGQTDTTHCNIHINAAESVSVIRSNINGAPFGIMLYGGIGSNFQFNNWYGNTLDVDTMEGADANFSFGWFEKGAPRAGPGANVIAENLQAARIEQAGPRP